MTQISILGLGWLGLPLAKKLIANGFSVNGTTTSVEKSIEINNTSKIEANKYSLDEANTRNIIQLLSVSNIIIIAIPASKVFLNLDRLITLLNEVSIEKEVLLISSTGVYPDSLELAEESYAFQESDFLNSNVQIEQRLTNEIKQRLTILRLAGLIGPNRHPITILSQKSNIPDGNAPVNLIHLNDVISLIETVINKNYFGQIINGCYPIHPTREEYYSNAAIRFNLTVPTFQKSTTKVKIISSKKSQIDLGFTYNQEI